MNVDNYFTEFSFLFDNYYTVDFIRRGSRGVNVNLISQPSSARQLLSSISSVEYRPRSLRNSS